MDRIAIWATRLFYLLSLLVDTELRLGRTEEAKDHLREMWDYAKQTKANLAFAFAYFADGLVSMSQGEWGKAIDSLHKSVAEWKKVGWVYEEAQALHQLGVAFQKKGDNRGANEPFNKALEIFTRMGAKLDVERVLARKELLKA